MEMTARDVEISTIVRKMAAMPDEDIAAFLVQVKGIQITPQAVGMYRPPSCN